MKKVLLFVDVEMPDSCALASRVNVFAMLFREMGFETHVLSGTSNSERVKYKCNNDGIYYSTFFCNQYSGLYALRRIRSINKQIESFLNQETIPFEYILLSNVYYDYSGIFLRYSKQYHSKLLVNAVEWYDCKDDLFRGFAGPVKFLKNRIALTTIFPKYKNVIAISSLLKDYYAKKKCNVILIPTILDTNEYDTFSYRKHNKLIISYAGSPAKKDIIKSAIDGVVLLRKEERNLIELHFFGPTLVQLEEKYGVNASLLKKEEVLVTHGRISQKDVKKYISTSDFTFLIRPNKRYANAGFPTKVGESLACGTPVIANLTSDLKNYIINGESGIVMGGTSAQNFSEAVRKGLAMTLNQYERMRTKAKTISREAFDYHQYIKPMEEFLNNSKTVE